MRRALLLAALLLVAWPAAAQPADDLLLAVVPEEVDVEAGLWRDRSGGGRDLVLKGFEKGPESGRRGTGAADDPFALRLDGNDDELGTRLREPAPTNLTLLVWIRTEHAGGKVAGFESSEDGSSTNRDRQMFIDDEGRPYFGIFTTNGTARGAAPIADGAWHLLAGVQEGARVALYVDGALAEERNATSSGVSFLGYWRFASGSPGWRNASGFGRLRGDLGPIELYDRPLSAAEHAAAFAEGPSGRGGWPPGAGARPPRLDDGLVLSIAGAQLVDASPHAQALERAAPSSGIAAPATAATAVDALRFDGEGPVTSSRSVFDPDAATMSLWFRTEQAGGKLVGFESSQNGSSTQYDRQLYMGADGRVHFGVFAEEGSLATRPGLADGEWHHLVGVIPSRGSGQGLRLYLDGELVNESATNDKPAYTGYWRVGGGTLGWRDAWYAHYAGLLAGVRVYERALRDDEARALYALGPDGSGPPRPSAPGGATLADARALHLDPANATLGDLGPRGNHATMPTSVPDATSGFVGSGTPEDPYAIAFDGVDDVLLTTTRFRDPDAFTISLWLNGTKPGKVFGFESSQNGSSTQYDRHLFMDAQGRLYFGIFTVGGTLRTEESLLDGKWHHVVASAGSRGSGDGMRLYVDGKLVAQNDVRDKPSYSGYWRAGGGTMGWANATRDPYFGGRLASILVHERALAPEEVVALHALGPGGTRDLSAPAPTPSVVVAPLDARIGATHTADEERVTFTLDLARVPANAAIRAILPDGSVADVDRSGAWTAPAREGGLYRFEALLPGPDGSMQVVASTQTLVLLPLATPPEAAGAIVVGLATTTLVAALSSRGFDLLAYLRSVLTTSTADRLKDKTKDRADLARAMRLGSAGALVLALLAWALLYAAGKPGALALLPFMKALFIAGLAVVALKALQTSLLYGLARTDGQGARYRFWTAGTLSLALSSVLFHVPFGYPGFLQREKPKGAAASSAKKDGLTGLATVCVLASLVPVFLGLGLLTGFAFAETAMAMAFAGFAVTAMPVKPMAGFAVWRWSRAVSLLLALVAFASYFAFQTGVLPWWGIVGLGVAGLAVVASVAALNVRARRTPRAEETPVAP